MFRLNNAALLGAVLVFLSGSGQGVPFKAPQASPVHGCTPVSGMEKGSLQQTEEHIQPRGNEKIMSASACIVVNVYGSGEGKRPEGVGSKVCWTSDANEPLHSREDLKKYIETVAEQLQAKGDEKPFLYLRGDPKTLFSASREVIQAAVECGVEKICFSMPPDAEADGVAESPQRKGVSSLPPALIFLLPDILFYGGRNEILHPVEVNDGNFEVLVEWLKTKKRDADSAGGGTAVQLLMTKDVSSRQVIKVFKVLSKADIASVALQTLKGC